MNLQTEDIINLRHYQYKNTINKTCFNQRDNDQNTDSVNNSSKEHVYCERFPTRFQFTINPNRYNMSMLSEQENHSTKASSESICSRYLHSTKCSPETLDNGKIEIGSKLCENIPQQKRGIQTRVTLSENPNQVTQKQSENIHEKLCSDKTTYCRPVVNLYNQEFLYKTMVKNAKLRRLVTELAIARRKEKEFENWNNYINVLRKKHNPDEKVKLANSLPYISDEYKTLDTIEDIYNTKFICKKSEPCQSLLHDLYNSHDVRGSNYDDDPKMYHENLQTPRSFNPFKTNHLCYPTSSQGRLILLERERMKRLKCCGYKPLFKTINEEKKIECPSPSKCDLKTIDREVLVSDSKPSYVARNSRSTNTICKCVSTQTEVEIVSPKVSDAVKSEGCNTHHVMCNKACEMDVENKATELKNCDCPDINNTSLVNIEEKLDNLIHSINNFIKEMKTKTAQYKTFDQDTKTRKKNVNYTRSDMCSTARKEKVICGCYDDSSRTTRNSSTDNFSTIQTIDENLTKINDILSKGVGKQQLITSKRSSIEGPCRACSVQISFAIPTREISTEVSRSLSKAANIENRNIIIEEILEPEGRPIAIAVNTDPLSLFAMLRVSTEETIRRLLSYVPSIDYYSYLFRLQGPSNRVIDSQFVCNICGAAFNKPSALTDHIQKHELGETRDCCVCRHVMDMPRRRPGLFKCQYCGQRFTRAYCCELHQEACAKRMGKLHDVPSSLMLLR